MMNGANAPYLKQILTAVRDATPDVRILTTTGVISSEYFAPGDIAFNVHSIQFKFDTIPTTSGDIVISAKNGTELFGITTQDATSISGVEFAWIPQTPLPFAAGEKLQISYANPDARAIMVRTVMTPRN
jgi:hypothetical protein